MLRGIIGSSLQLRFILAFLAVALLVTGVVQLRGRPVDLLPEFSPPQVEIQTEALGLAAAEVEALITVPLEEMVSGVPWLLSMHARSIPGLSSIVLTFEPGTDVMDARQMVQERLLHTSALPRVSKRPAMLQPVSSTNRVMNIGLRSDTLSLIETSVLARWNIKPRLLGVPGVANVAIWGQRERQLQVQVDPQLLRDKGLRLADVVTAAGDAMWSSPLSFLQASTPGNGGFIDTPNQRLDIRHIQPITTPDALAKVSFKGADGALFRLGEVAQVVEGHQPLIGDGVVNDRPGLMLVVEKFPWANTLEVTAGVEAALEALKPGLPGVEVDPTIFRPATFIEQAIGNLGWAVLIGGVLAALALLALFLQWRAALIAIVTIPLALLAATWVLHLLGATINTMMLAGLGIALACVIDDAVVGIDAILRRLREGGDASIGTAVLEATLETRGTVLFGTLVAVLAVVPVVLMGGLMGAFLQPLAVAYLAALLASLVMALVVAPALALILLDGTPRAQPEPLPVEWAQSAYEGALGRVLAVPGVAMAAGAVALLLGLALLSSMGQSLLPTFKERDFLMRWAAEPGISYPEMSRMTSAATQELRKVAGVRNVAAHVGRAATSDHVSEINTAEVWVSVDPSADYDATTAAIQAVVESYPGLEREVLSFSTTRLKDVLAPPSEDGVAVRVYGPELGELREQAEKVMTTLGSIDGLQSLHIEERTQEPELAIEVDLEAAERHGIKPGDVRRAASTLVAGLEVGSLYEEQKVFEVMVWGAPEIRNDPAVLQELLLDTPSGGHVRLGDVARVSLASSPNLFERAGASHWVEVSAEVSGRDVGAVLGDVQAALGAIDFPLEYHPELVGDYAEQEATRLRMLGYVAAAAIGILLLFQAACGSWRLGTALFLAMPAALSGGVLAALIGGGTVTLGSLAGFLALLGIAARHAVLTVHGCRRLQRDAGARMIPALVTEGAADRLWPIVMSIVTTALAMAPFVVLGEVAGLEILHPMAVVVLGGLVTTTLVDLFVVPALCVALGAPAETETMRSLSHAPS